MTPCEKLGYKVGDRFVVINEDNYHQWPIGTIVVLHKDDKSYSPKFRNERNYDERCYMYLYFVKPLTPIIKDGDTIERDGKKYRVTLKEIPQYVFNPGMVCKIDWGGSRHNCIGHSHCNTVVYLEAGSENRAKIAYAHDGGFMCIGFVNTSSLRPE